ncbi:hypothetical protein YPPY32_3036, partial [Yersinia pestis PY-32]
MNPSYKAGSGFLLS